MVTPKKNIAQEYRFPITSNRVALGAAAISATLGLMVLVGWYTHTEILIQVHPTFVAMQYNTALGFLLCGAGLLAIVLGRPRLAIASGSFVTAIGLLTLIEYVAEVGLGIDQLLMEHHITVETSHPGRMAPSTALCFSLMGTALLANAMLRRFRPRSLILGLIGSVIAALGSIAFASYLGGLETAYGWGHLTRMAVHTALGFAVLGIGVVSFALGESRAEDGSVPRWLPIPVAVGSLTFAIALWQGLQQQENEQIALAVKAEARALKGALTQEVVSRTVELQRMADRWEVGGRTPRTVWEADARAYIKDQSAFQAIEWVDASFHVRWIVPLKGNEAAQDLDLRFEERRRVMLEAAVRRDEVTVTQTVDLVQGGKGFLVFLPLFVGETFDGFILGVFAVENAFTPILQERAEFGYSSALFDRPEKILAYSVADSPDDLRWSQDVDFKHRGLTLRARIWPGPELLAEKQSAVPEAALLAGLLMGSLLTITVHLSQTTLRRMTKTERRQLEHERAALNQFAIVAETDARGRITYVNDKFCEISKYSREELIGQDHRIVNSGHHPKSFFKEMYATISGGGVWRGEIKNNAKDGSIYWVDTVIVPFMSDDGRVEKYLTIRAVITERKRVEEERLRLIVEHERNHLKEAVAAQEQLLGVVGHELRTPLAALRATSEYLLSGDPQDAEEREMFLQIIHDETVRMAEMVNNLLEAARLNSGCARWNWSVVKLAEVCDEAFRVVRPLVDHAEVDMHWEVDSPDLAMLGDAEAIRRLLINLISNSVKHTKEGAIRVSAREILKPDHRWIELQIHDTGEGISEAVAAKLGQAFVLNSGLVGPDYVKGTGLGLAICQGIASAHGGTISVDSRPGQGSTFTVLLRADLSEPAEPTSDARITAEAAA